MTDAARRDKRYRSEQRLLVRCASWAEFAELYAADVSQGGMFIVTDDPPPVFSEVDLSVALPEGHELQLKGTVVHVLDAQQAAAQGRSAGVGVQFEALDPLQKQQIYQLIEFARWEGSADNPTASYASRLFETSAALPPSKVLDALPPATETATPRATPDRPPPGASTSVQPSGPSGAPRSDARSSSRSGPASPGSSAPAPAASPAPADGALLDRDRLKLGMTHLAHKRFDHAIAIFEALQAASPDAREASLWLHLAHARVCLKHGDEDGAAEHYRKVLEADEGHHEARRFVREHSQKKRLHALPFGRYFVKKR